MIQTHCRGYTTTIVYNCEQHLLLFLWSHMETDNKSPQGIQSVRLTSHHLYEPSGTLSTQRLQHMRFLNQLRRWHPHTHIFPGRGKENINDVRKHWREYTVHYRTSQQYLKPISAWLLPVRNEEVHIHTEFFKAAASRDIFVQYSSAFPLGIKTGYARNELAGIKSKYKKTEEKVTHTSCFLDVLKINRSTIAIINLFNYSRQKPWRLRKTQEDLILKIFHFSEMISIATRRDITR